MHLEVIRMVLLLRKVSDRKKTAWCTWLRSQRQQQLMPVWLHHGQVTPFLLLLLAFRQMGFFLYLPLGTLPTFTAFCLKGLTFYFISSDILYLVNHVIIKCHLVILLLTPSAPLKSHCVTDTWKRWGCPGWLRGGAGGLNSTVIIFFCITFGIIRKMLFLKQLLLVLSSK